jgi:hypothetical protein
MSGVMHGVGYEPDIPSGFCDFVLSDLFYFVLILYFTCVILFIRILILNSPASSRYPLWVLNARLSNISAISWTPIVLGRELH